MLIYLHFLCIFKLLAADVAHAGLRPDIPEFASLRRLIAHTAHTKMASITKLPSGAYRVQIRRKGRFAARDGPKPRRRPRSSPARAETRVDQGLAPTSASVSRLQTFGDLIDLHITDMCEVGKPPRREPRPPRSRRSSAIWARRRSVTSTVREWLTTSEKRTVSAPKRRSTIRL